MHNIIHMIFRITKETKEKNQLLMTIKQKN